MSREDLVKTTGTITSVHGYVFKVKLSRGGEIIAQPNGKLNKFLGSISKARRQGYLLVGDTVDLELSPYDLTRGLIAWRHRNGKD